MLLGIAIIVDQAAIGASFAAQSDTIDIRVTVIDLPPSGSVLINNGDATTTSTSVTLTLSAIDAESTVDQMRFSNDGTAWSTPEPFAIEKSWTLSDGDGEKTVYVRFRDSAGHWSAFFSDIITLNMLITTNITYTYDDLNRLKDMTHGTVSTTYNYDEVGNITHKTTIGN